MRQLQRIAIAPSQKQQEQIILTAEQQHYLYRVLRLAEGDRFIAMDGQGQWLLTEITGEQARVLEELEIKNQELPTAITLISALPKNGFDEVVRCCTELGVTCIAPVISKRTVLKPSSQKLQRWQKIAQEAAEQSERAFVPKILDPVSFNLSLSSLPDLEQPDLEKPDLEKPDLEQPDLEKLDLENFVTKQQKYICTARGEFPHLFTCLSQQKCIKYPQTNSQIWVATGPEGGWTEKEIDLAIASGFQAVSLGKRILRSVTAPIVALSIVATVLESNF